MDINLDEMKNKLYDAFNKALDAADRCKYSHTSSGEAKAAADYVEAASKAAIAITTIEQEQREAKERGVNKLEKN
ncbi:MAG: hypothetical protein K8R48_00445 [Alphaproteobacteria bacterium]|nr:hypothetical protein [Alphaproteobacteria bacterium]